MTIVPTVILSVAALTTVMSATAQHLPCGLTTMTETVQPYYPPIARAAHVAGVVVMLVEFDRNGIAQSVQVVGGPEMLRQSATSSAKTWHANPYAGPRTCPVAVSFHLNRDDEKLPPVLRTDLQHIVVNSDFLPPMY